MNILIADRDEGMCRFLQTVLEDNGYRVNTTTSGIDALQEIEHSRPDLVVMDITMTVGDELPLGCALSNDPQTWEIPIVGLLSISDPGIRSWIRKIGLCEILEKPFTIDDALNAVKNALTCCSC